MFETDATVNVIHGGWFQAGVAGLDNSVTLVDFSCTVAGEHPEEKVHSGIISVMDSAVTAGYGISVTGE
jgi:hypothetical protein